MNFLPEYYTKINGLAQRDGLELLYTIFKSLVVRAEIILDVGSGSGEVSTMIADAIPHKRFIALDIDPTMLEFHAANHHRNSMEYVQQDFGVPFEKLDSSLQKLEAKIEFIMSNDALHLIPPASRKNVANNITRLLKPGCFAYLSIICLSDRIFDYCEDTEIRNYFRVPSYEDQMSSWKEVLSLQGLTLLEAKRAKKMYAFDTVEQFRMIRKVSDVYKIYCSDQLTGAERTRVIEALEEPLLVYHGMPHDKKGVKPSSDNANVYYELIKIVVRR